MARTAMAVVREKQIRALELVRAGNSYDEIAEDLGYASRSSAWRLVNNGLKTAVQRVADDYLQTELARLDAVQVAYWAAALDCDYRAAILVLRVMEHRTRLLGLDKPTPPPARMPCALVCPVLYATRNATEVGKDAHDGHEAG